MVVDETGARWVNAGNGNSEVEVGLESTGEWEGKCGGRRESSAGEEGGWSGVVCLREDAVEGALARGGGSGRGKWWRAEAATSRSRRLAKHKGSEQGRRGGFE